MQISESETFYPKSSNAWRNWLEKNHDKAQSVWLLFYRKGAGVPTISWSDAVDEALCFGWVDSKVKPLDTEKFIQFFSRRKPRGTWSKINKAKIEQLILQKRMTEAGFKVIEAAKQNGSWNILDEVEELIIPKDLTAAFTKHTGSEAFFLGLSKSVRKAMLQWLVLAKRPETREKRLTEIAELAAKRLKPKQF